MSKKTNRAHLLAGTATLAALIAGTGLAAPALAQTSSDDDSGLGIIIVTAQKREQNVQDVPIAVTALTAETLEANRITDVSALNSLAPGLTVSQAVGGALLPSFSMRGAVSFGVTPGTDKQISTYLDGVYLSAGRGAMFNLPNLASIEVLRGPQGTLFGRNATAGAVNIRTSDPSGELGAKASATVGNQNEYGFKVGVDLPQMGPFSAYANYVRDKRRGDIRNVGVPVTWDRRASLNPINRKLQTTAPYLGSTDSHSIFAAVKFESGDFTTVYKYDWSRDKYTPQANVPAGILNSPSVSALVNAQQIPVVVAADGRRPKTALNSWTVQGYNKTWGHSLTSTLVVDDHVSIKNIAAYRKSWNFAASAIDGMGGLVYPFPPAVGQPFVFAGTEGDYYARQISDEIQFNYESDFLTAVAGGLYFLGKTTEGASHLQPTFSNSLAIGGVIPRAKAGEYYNRTKSIAAYAQLEFHLTPQIDAIVGGRITKDNKSGFLLTGQTETTLVNYPFTNKDSRFTYLAGLNYKPTDDIMLYGKYSTAFVSGGSVAGIPFKAETAKSIEIGAKTEFLDRKVRANIALYHVKYNNVQYIGGGTTYAPVIADLTGDPNRATAVQSFIFNPGSPLVAKGVELDLAIAPARGLTLGGVLGYTDAKYNKPENIRQIILAANGGQFLATGRPKWVGSAFIQYNTLPVIAGGYISFRIDASYQSKKLFYPNPEKAGSYAAAALAESPYALVNSRIALTDMEMAGVKTTFALWGQNIFDERRMASAYDVRFAAITNFIPARAYGFDVTFEY